MNNQAQQLDIDLLNRYLIDKIEGFQNIIECKKFNIGQSNPTYLLNTPSRQYVLRRQPPGKLLKSAHQVDREFRVMQALYTTAVPVPQVHHLCEDRDVIGSQFFIMDFANGTQHANPTLLDVDKSERADYFFALVDNIAAMHNLDLVEIGLDDFGKGTDFFKRQIDLWIRQYRAAETDPRANVETLINELPKLLPADSNERVLIHGDYKFDNLIFEKDKPKILATLDWELSTIGHPIADLAYMCMNFRLPADKGISKGLAGIDKAACGIPSEQALIDRYCEQRGLSAIDNMNFYLAFSFFRLASICQGVYKRAISGNASSEQGKLAGEFTDVLAKLGVELLD